MARLDEIAEGIAMMLISSPVPEPFNVCLRGESSTETTFLIRAVIDSCERREFPLNSVRVGPILGADLLKQYGDEESGYQGVSIRMSNLLALDVEFYRF
jgi:hypothetical protein